MGHNTGSQWMKEQEHFSCTIQSRLLKSALYDHFFCLNVSHKIRVIPIHRCKKMTKSRYKEIQKDNFFADAAALFFQTETYPPECSFELHNRSSGVTCEWFSWPEDQSRAAYLREHLLLSTKASAVRPTLRVADLQLPGRLRREPTQPQTNTLLDNFKHGTQLWTSLPHMKDGDSSFIWARRLVWWNALTYMGTVQVWLSTIRLMSVMTTVHVRHNSSKICVKMSLFSFFGTYEGEALIKWFEKANWGVHFLTCLLQQLVRGSYSPVNLGSKTFEGKVIFLT